MILLPEPSHCALTRLRRLTRHRTPDAVVDLLEVGTACVARGEVAGIFHDRRDDHPFVAVRLAGDGEILGNTRLFAVRNAILLEVSGPQVGRHDRELTARTRPAA